MTKEELARLLEQFAIVVLQTAQTGLDADAQYKFIVDGIDTVVETVVFVNDRNRLTIPSAN
jgi:hypothetical protein